MGQNSSRNRHDSLPEPPVPSTSSRTLADPETPSEATTAQWSKQSRRASVRKSILNLVKTRPRTVSTPTYASPHAPTPPKSTSQRRWRRSRHWDKVEVAQAALDVNADEAVDSPLMEQLGEKEKETEVEPSENAAVEPPTQSPTAPPTPPSLAESQTVTITQNLDDETVDSTNPATEASAADLLKHEDVSADRVDVSPGDSSRQADVILPTPEFPTIDAIDSSLTPTDIPSPSSPVPTQILPPPSQPPVNRSFAPPGTLVVVQGVVHTTEVQRPTTDSSSSYNPESPTIRRRSSSTPRPSTPRPASVERARNRLSALLRARPTSAIAASASAGETDRRRSTSGSITSVPSVTSTQENSASAEIAAHTSTPPEISANPITAEEEHIQPSSESTRAISSNSIDVLGTLLSVAAAATAASLLTGSTEPVLSGGPSTSPQSHTSDASTTLSSTHTAPPSAIPATSPSLSPGLPLLGTDLPTTGAGRSERMRQAWSSIRERLGLRPAAGTDLQNGDGAPVDARERMLAEMARAFNLGLGLTGEALNGSPSSNTENSESAPSQPTAPLPAEGSFERFLLDLQSDLRVALTRNQTSEGTGGPLPAAGVAPSLSSDDALDSQPILNSSSEHEINHADEEDLDTSDDDDSSDDESFGNDTPDTSATEEEPAQPAGPSPTMDPSPGRINWWRLYRFPPITAPRAADAMANMRNAASSPETPTSPLTSMNATELSPSPSVASNGIPLTDSPSSHVAPNSSDGSPAETTRPASNIVVPVIVVGLQSVSLRADSGNAPSPISPQTPTATGTGADLSDGGETAVPDATDDDRGRRWLPRAANALRSLRPGNRGPGTGDSDSDAQGTRTFLIYVIGGYYPPDHSIVTSEPNNLDSFEALLDLAELLGQVKPQTVSRDEINKSGLEVIKSPLVAQYEADGKISNNCTERCLICLDEYAPDDDVRVMTCRHAFHKNCVDTWLQTGKNNCPACRSKGVPGETATEP